MGIRCLDYDPTFIVGSADNCSRRDSLNAALDSSCRDYCLGLQNAGETLSTSCEAALVNAVAVGGNSGEFVAAQACQSDKEGRLGVREYEYPIECGCAQEPWIDGGEQGSKVCTIPIDTTITWKFRGGVDHNVVSSGSFESDLCVACQFKHTFDQAGEYSYDCSIHPEMNGYSINVLAAP